MSGLSRGALWGAGVGVVLTLLVTTGSLGDFATPLIVVMLVAMVIGSFILPISPGPSNSPVPAWHVASGTEIFGYLAIIAISMVVGSLIESVYNGAGWKDVPRYMKIFLWSSLVVALGVLFLG